MAESEVNKLLHDLHEFCIAVTKNIGAQILLEELRVSFFKQDLRTPQPVSIKRLEKA